MNFRQISSWSIKNPVPPIVLFIGLLLAGIYTFTQMTVTQNPDIDFPAAEIDISQPGAAPSEMETQITQKVEAAVRGVNGVDEINSQIREGSSSTFVQFQIGTPTDRAVNDIRDAITQIRGDLPDGILEPQVQRVDIAGDPITYVAVQTNDMTLEQLSWFIDNDVARQLRSVAGVAAVSREGGVDREIKVILDPAALNAQGITAAQVNAQLRQVNLNATGGRAEVAGSEQAVRVVGNAHNAYDLSQTEISVGNGRTVRLADIAQVVDGYSEQRTIAKQGNSQVVSFNVQRTSGTSDLSVYDATWAKLHEIEKADPRIHFEEISNSVDYTRDQYKSSMAALFEGAALAVLVVYLFLRDGRATAISALAIPLSAIPAFTFMNLMGINLNGLSLLAMSLVAGVLVDDAIVEIENIVRHMRMGKSAYQASLDAADEIGLAVLATTMSIVAVFLPVALMPGISGQFFKSFGFTVVLSVLMSLFVARMITPLIAAYFLKSHGIQPHAAGKGMERYLGLLRWSLDSSKPARLKAGLPPARTRFHYVLIAIVMALAILVAMVAAGGAVAKMLGLMIEAKLLIALVALLAAGLAAYLAFKLCALVAAILPGHYGAWYRRVVTGLHDHRIQMVGWGFAALALTLVMMGTLPMQFQPDVNVDSSDVRVGLAPGTTLADSQAAADRATAVLRSDPDVRDVFERIFVGSAHLVVNLKKDRPDTTSEFENRLKPKLAALADSQTNFISRTNGGPGGASRDIMLFLGSSDPILLQQTAEKISAEMEGLSEVRAPRVMGEQRRPEIRITPHFDLAASLGVTTSALSNTIRIATIGEIDQNSAKFSLSDRQVPINVALPQAERTDLATLENLPVPTTSGGSVPLKAVADIGFGSGPASVSRTDQQRRLAVGADLTPGVVSSQAWAKINQLPTLKNLPHGVQTIALGSQKWQAELVYYFVIALAAGIMLVFAVLVLLYRRFLSPFVNMGSLLLAPLGAAIALHIAGQPLSLPVFIGVLMLFGIVAKNSILLIDFAVEMIDHGMTKDEAIAEAGHKRAQPIVMTTVAMVAGMIPVSLSLTGDGSWRAPMGITVMGGLIFSTVLTLLLVPAYFSIALDIESWIGRGFRRVIDNGEEHQPMKGPVPVAAE